MKNTRLLTWMAQNYLQIEQFKVLTQNFTNARPFPHVTFRNFFLPRMARVLQEKLVAQEFFQKNTDLFSFWQTNDLTETQKFKKFYEFLRSPEFISYISMITTTQLSRTIDLAGSVYRKGDYLLPHDDRLEGRKIAYILNLSEHFSSCDGGALALFEAHNKRPTTVVKRIIPSFNTLTLFRVSEKSFHQVEEVLTNKPRISIGGWFHGK